MPNKDLTWKEVLLFVLEGYICVVLFFIVAKLTMPDFLFGGLTHKFSYEVYFRMIIIFLIAYTFYAINKIIWFSLRKNGYCSAIYGSIRRFFETYVWCLYIGFIPFCFLIALLPSVFLRPGNVSYVIYTNGFPGFPAWVTWWRWNAEVAGSFLLDLYCLSIVFSSYLAVLILIQRFIFACHQAATDRPIGKQEDNVRFWQSTATPITLYTIFRYFAFTIGDFCYWFAMVLVLPIALYTFMYDWRSSATGNGNGNGMGAMVGAMYLIAFALFFCVTIFYLAFSIIMRRLFSVIRKCMRLCFAKNM